MIPTADLLHYFPPEFAEYRNSAVAVLFITALCNLAYWLSYFVTKPRAEAPENGGGGTSIPRAYPVIGMMPALSVHAHRIHDYSTEVLRESGGTFQCVGPMGANMDMLGTCEPANIHHIFSRNFSNYPKGPDFRKMFDVLGDGIFNVDSELWELHRKTTLSFFTHADFNAMLERNVWEKMERGMFPVLNHFSDRGAEFDLQDVFQRFTFDTIAGLVLNEDPGSLAVDFPYHPCEKGFNHMIDALLYRHMLPETVWRAQNFIGIGKEKKLNRARRDFDDFIYSSIRRQQEQGRTGESPLFVAFEKAYRERPELTKTSLEEFLRDTFLSLMFAGRDTTSTALTWLFWLLAENPHVLAEVRREIEEKLNLDEKEGKLRYFKAAESKKLVYLHGALCESLRLFPPVALEHKVAAKKDILPSGHPVKPGTRVIVSFYAAGRLETIWGKDCMEFKPERWISGRGSVRHEPSYKFPAFNAGPRTCLGKDMAFVQMKMVAATMLHHYDFQVVDRAAVCPSDSIILQAKHGLRVRFSRRLRPSNGDRNLVGTDSL
ncbi:unnamed protein product [Cuscuta campestris]|uniref:Cytochrome P450 n=1 Tax=Cuscuta campestris TaxID=132261 RepID=A0A484MT44_9ASTE|nr:unnamed protein product [Cuscuta campestris]